MKVSTKLTSIKIIEDVYKQFKLMTINSKMSLQKLVNRSMDLYVSEDDFVDKINDYDNLINSGSGF
tara:strand:- start:445 stop:642 length:198 start_codon:yes stop_codon:yes gene_type:complete